MSIDLFFSARPAVIVHSLFAFVALGLGIAMFIRKKGTPSHKLIGKVFVLVMAVTAITALFITGINGNHYSFVHL